MISPEEEVRNDVSSQTCIMIWSIIICVGSCGIEKFNNWLWTKSKEVFDLLHHAEVTRVRPPVEQMDFSASCSDARAALAEVV